MRKKYSFFCIALLILSTYSWALAQTTKSLEDEVDEAEAKAKIAKAKKEELEAKFPSPDADALKANNSVEGNLIESRIQAYKAMENISGQIADQLSGKGISELYVFNDSDFAKIVAYKKLNQQLDIINAEYARCFPIKAAGLPLGVLSSVFLSWLPLLKTDTKINGEEFDIENDAVLASLGQALSAKGIRLGNPFVSNFDLVDLGAAPAPLLILKLSDAEHDLNTPVCSDATYTLKPMVDAAFQKLKEDIGLTNQQTRFETTETNSETTVIPPKTTVVEVTRKIPASVKPAAPITFWDYVRVEKVQSLMQANGIFWIKIKNSKSGGNMRIKSNPLIDIFRGGSSVKFSGGSIAYYYIFDNKGKTIISGVVKGYLPYEKSSKL